MPNTIYPVKFRWTGSVMEPVSLAVASRYYTEGEEYRLVPDYERSLSSHRHYFAALREAWLNLSAELEQDFPTAEHLRHYALIKTGWCNERALVCSSKAEALRVAAFLRPANEFAIVLTAKAVVSEFTARSQSYKAMGKADFEKSKADVLDYVAGLIGLTADELKKNSGAAA